MQCPNVLMNFWILKEIQGVCLGEFSQLSRPSAEGPDADLLLAFVPTSFLPLLSL